MTLANEDLPQLKSYFYEWLAEADSSRRPGAFELSLQERLIRVEETLSNQIELTRQRRPAQKSAQTSSSSCNSQLVLSINRYKG
jgi:hypothetical protein